MAKVFEIKKHSYVQAVRFSLIALTACILMFVSCNSTKASVKDEPLVQNSKIECGELDNGINYYVLTNNEPQNRIFLRLVVQAGAAMETESEKGVAHFVEHMCFNGTEHFAENSLIDYAESIGMAFGPEVNAYTSFEETVYMFEVPADKPEYFDQAMLIFKDWASAVTFDPVELDKERGVILEEWRGKQGLNWRLVNEVLPFELKDSVYPDRLPIGSMDVVQNISRDDVKAFYDKWYRPENISVVVSGVIDSKVAASKISEVMSAIPASEKRIDPPKFSVPLRKDKDIMIFRDAEMPYLQVQFVQQENKTTGRATVQEYRKLIAQELLCSVVNMRLNEITQTAESPWLVANCNTYSETNTAYFGGLNVVPKEGMFEEAVKTLFDEYDRVLTQGITDSEYNRVKEQLLSDEERWYEQRLGISSSDRCQSICNQILLGKTSISDEDMLKNTKNAVASISKEDLVKELRAMITDRGTMCIIYAPQSAELPSKEEIMDIWKNYQNEELSEYVDDELQDSLMPRPEKKASIAKKNELKEINSKEYVLSNGIKIITKKTNYDKNQIFLKAVSKGGTAKVSDNEIPSCVFAPMYAIYSGIGDMKYTQLQKWFSDKQIDLNININPDDEYISSYSRNEDLEEMLQLVYLIMENPKFTDDGWNQVVVNAEQSAKMHGVQPIDYFYDTIRKTVYGESFRFSAVTPEFAKQIDRQTAERIFRERFGNPCDFTFTFVGDFDESKLIELCRLYLGNLSGDEKAKEDFTRVTVDYSKQKKNVVVKKGTDNKGIVFIDFIGVLPETTDCEQKWKDAEMIEQVRQLLDIRLREVIREDKSGTYGVSVFSQIENYQDRIYQYQITFGCEPSRKEELTEEVIKTINELKKDIPDLYIQKLHEAYRRNFESNQRNNYWWQNMMVNSIVMDYVPVNSMSDDTSVIQWTTAESLKSLLNQYFDENNYVVVYFVPEK